MEVQVGPTKRDIVLVNVTVGRKVRITKRGTVQ